MPLLRASLFTILFSCALLIAIAKADAVTASATNPAGAAYGPWRSSRIGGGGYLGRVIQAPSRPDTLYTYIDVAGCFRSDDAGRSWRMLHGGLPARAGNYCVRDLAVDPRDENIVMIAVGSQWFGREGVYRSTDGGTTWSLVLAAQFYGNENWRWAGVAFARHPTRPDTLYVASANDGLWRSDDNGLTWKNLGLTGLFPTDLRIDPSDTNRLWLCASATTLSGKPALAGGFFRSTDAGATWEKLHADSPLPVEILPDTQSPGLLLGLADSGKVIHSTDAGATWEDYNQGLPLDPAGRKSLPWSEGRFQAIARTPNHWITASGNGTFYRRSPDAATWEKLPAPHVEEGDWFGRIKAGEWTHFGKALGSIVVDAHDPKHWWFTDWYAIYETTDSGASWTLRINGIEATVLHTLAQDAADPGALFIGMADLGVFYSEDGGNTFKKPDTSLNNAKTVAFSPAMPTRLYATGNNKGQWYADNIFVSLDRGRTWNLSPAIGLPTKDRRNNALTVSQEDAYHVYLGVSGPVAPGQGGVYESTDGSARWTWIGAGLPQGRPFFQADIWNVGPALAAGPGGELMAVSRGLGLAYVRTADGGWRASPLPARNPHSLVADPSTHGRFYVGSSDGIFVTDDTGLTWRKIFDRDAPNVAVDLAHPARLAAGTPDGVVLSEDSGKTWRDLDRALPNRVNNLVAFAGDRLFAGSLGNGVFWMPLTPQGSLPVTARHLEPVFPPASARPLPELVNLDPATATAAPGRLPQGWAVWTGAGRFEASLPPATDAQPQAAFRLSAIKGFADGTLYQSFAAVPNPFIISGTASALPGKVEECLVALQIFDADGTQIDWLTLTSVQADGRWTAFTRTVQLPSKAARVSLLVRYRGDSEVRLGRITITSPPAIFLNPSAVR